MMKLKYLFDNRNLALMLLDYWDYDKDNIEIMNYFRISANAVYPFRRNDKVFFLRFSPIEEKLQSDLLAELDFLEYLQCNDYPIADIIKTKDHRKFVLAETPWGSYLAVVFKSVDGKQMEKLPYSKELYCGYGKSLGHLHRLSQTFETSKVLRPDWKERLFWTKEVLQEYSAPNNSIMEVDILLDFLSSIEVNKKNFGLIHYDFELDNVFYEKSNHKFSVIDFDDSVYHWFVMDIEQSLNSIECEIADEYHEQAKESFMTGYESEMDISDDMIKLLPVFRRYANVFGYARCLRSLHDTWSNEPDWMTELRGHIQNLMVKRQEKFGSKIELQN